MDTSAGLDNPSISKRDKNPTLVNSEWELQPARGSLSQLNRKRGVPDIVSGDDLMVLSSPIIEDFDGFLHARVDTVGIETVLRQQ